MILSVLFITITRELITIYFQKKTKYWTWKNILMVGPTESIAKTLARILKVPFATADPTSTVGVMKIKTSKSDSPNSKGICWWNWQDCQKNTKCFNNKRCFGRGCSTSPIVARMFHHKENTHIKKSFNYNKHSFICCLCWIKLIKVLVLMLLFPEKKRKLILFHRI